MATQMQRRALPNALLVILLIIDRVSSSSCPDLFDTWTPPGLPARSLSSANNLARNNKLGGPQFDKKYANTADYWDERYVRGDARHGYSADSGAGSRGKLARWKAKVVNAFVKRNKVHKVVDFGCGDGNQLSLSKYKLYTGLDVSKIAVQRLAQQYAHDWRKRFVWYDGTRSSLTSGTDGSLLRSDMTMSMEVIFHLTDADIFQHYMELLFDVSKRFVVILSNSPPVNENCVSGVCFTDTSHVRWWSVTSWVDQYRSDEWELVGTLRHKYVNEAWSDFYFYARKDKCV